MRISVNGGVKFGQGAAQKSTTLELFSMGAEGSGEGTKIKVNICNGYFRLAWMRQLWSSRQVILQQLCLRKPCICYPSVTLNTDVLNHSQTIQSLTAQDTLTINPLVVSVLTHRLPKAIDLKFTGLVRFSYLALDRLTLNPLLLADSCDLCQCRRAEAMVDQPQHPGAQLIGIEVSRRGLVVACQALDLIEVGILRALRQVGHTHLLDHALAKRAALHPVVRSCHHHRSPGMTTARRRSGPATDHRRDRC